ncbi:uncharacterized protein LOC130635583 [Hydractinia symbiolongicarpus]|uniref:uncharacterized protein LOC130635583 n=1 Tax=Hydractinia symbiolongicarpus TaxID=13093 RepID=UPI00254E168D|nr:uncharacterized protein LOC130635583 [Hydractinia symbiolongicarpus]
MPRKKCINISPSEEVLFMKKLAEEKRKCRLQQVREQEKHASLVLREKVKKRKERELKKIAMVLQGEFDENKEEEEKHLLFELERRLRQIGEGHKVHDKENYGEIKNLSANLKRNISRRYKHAINKVLNERQEENAKQHKLQLLRDQIRIMEEERKQKIVSLPKQPADPIMSIQPVKVVSSFTKQGMLESFSYTHHHLASFDSESGPTMVVVKACEEEQIDARLAANDEEERTQSIKEQQAREIEERKEKAELRHDHARKEVILKQQKASLMEELENLELKDRQRRREIVADIPKKVFQPPYQRIEDGKSKQFSLEQAFEKVYNVKSEGAFDKYYNNISELGNSTGEEASTANESGLALVETAKRVTNEISSSEASHPAHLQKDQSKLERLRTRIKQQHQQSRKSQQLEKTTPGGLRASLNVDSLQSMNIESAYESIQTKRSSSRTVTPDSATDTDLQSEDKTTPSVEVSDLTASNIAYNHHLLKHQSHVLELQKKKLMKTLDKEPFLQTKHTMLDSSQQIDVFMPHVSNISGTPSSYVSTLEGNMSSQSVNTSQSPVSSTTTRFTTSLEEQQLNSEKQTPLRQHVSVSPHSMQSLKERDIQFAEISKKNENVLPESFREEETQTERGNECNAETQTSLVENYINNTEQIEELAREKQEVKILQLKKDKEKKKYDVEKIAQKKKQLMAQYPNLFTSVTKGSPVTLERIQNHRKQLQKQRQMLEQRRAHHSNTSRTSSSNTEEGLFVTEKPGDVDVDATEVTILETRAGMGEKHAKSLLPFDNESLKEQDVPKRRNPLRRLDPLTTDSTPFIPTLSELELSRNRIEANQPPAGREYDQNEIDNASLAFPASFPHKRLQTNIPNLSDLDLTEISYSSESNDYLLPSVRTVLEELKKLKTSINETTSDEDISSRKQHQNKQFGMFIDRDENADAADFTSSMSIPSYSSSMKMYELPRYEASPVRQFDSPAEDVSESTSHVRNLKDHWDVSSFYGEGAARPFRVSANPQVSPIREVEELTPQRLTGLSTLEEQSLSGSSLPIQTRTPSFNYDEEGLSIARFPSQSENQTHESLTSDALSQRDVPTHGANSENVLTHGVKSKDVLTHGINSKDAHTHAVASEDVLTNGANFEDVLTHGVPSEDVLTHGVNSEDVTKFYPLRELKASMTDATVSRHSQSIPRQRSFSNDVHIAKETERADDVDMQGSSLVEQYPSSDDSPLFLPKPERHAKLANKKSPIVNHFASTSLSLINTQSNSPFYSLDRYSSSLNGILSNSVHNEAPIESELNRANNERSEPNNSTSAPTSALNNNTRPTESRSKNSTTEFTTSHVRQLAQDNQTQNVSQPFLLQPFGISSSSTLDSIASSGKYRELLERVKKLPFVHMEEQQTLIESFSREQSSLSESVDLSSHSITSEFGDVRIGQPVIISNESGENNDRSARHSNSHAESDFKSSLRQQNLLESSNNSEVEYDTRQKEENRYSSTSNLSEQILNTNPTSYFNVVTELRNDLSTSSQSEVSFKGFGEPTEMQNHTELETLDLSQHLLQTTSASPGEENSFFGEEEVNGAHITNEANPHSVSSDSCGGYDKNKAQSEKGNKFLMSYFEDITLPDFSLRKFSGSGSEKFSLMSLTQESFLGLPLSDVRASIRNAVIPEEPMKASVESTQDVEYVGNRSDSDEEQEETRQRAKLNDVNVEKDVSSEALSLTEVNHLTRNSRMQGTKTHSNSLHALIDMQTSHASGNTQTSSKMSTSQAFGNMQISPTSSNMKSSKASSNMQSSGNMLTSQGSGNLQGSKTSSGTQSLLKSDQTLTELLQLVETSTSPSSTSSLIEKSTIDLINELISSRSPLSDTASSELFTVGKLKLRDESNKNDEGGNLSKIHTDISLLSDLELSSMSEHSVNWSTLLPYSKASSSDLSNVSQHNEHSSDRDNNIAGSSKRDDLSLQEAFAKRKQQFIKKSSARLESVNTRAAEKDKQFERQKDFLKKKEKRKVDSKEDAVPKTESTAVVPDDKLDKEKLKEKRIEDRHRTKRLYERLPEVQKQTAEREKKEAMKRNKEKVQRFHEKLQEKRKRQLQKKSEK